MKDYVVEEPFQVYKKPGGFTPSMKNHPFKASNFGINICSFIKELYFRTLEKTYFDVEDDFPKPEVCV